VRWVGAYGLLIAVSLVMTSVAIILTVKLFQIIGPRRTRIVAQIIAAIVGGIFVIGLQIAAMFSGGTFSRLTFLESDFVVNNVPDGMSLLWWPARAALGDWHCLAWVFGIALLLFLTVTIRYAPRFAGYVFAATAMSYKSRIQTAGARSFRVGTPSAMLRRKERLLILRDSWLISQSLMQLLYLLPPALLLWRNYGKGGVAVVLLPVLIMSAGQLAGGLAWLTISGEDAPDLVSSAPVAPKQLLRAKMEAVMQCIGAIFGPFVLVLALSSGREALVAAAGIVAAAISSIAIQLWFRTQAKRTQFRRRHTSSRIATLAETLVAISWAGAGGAAVTGSSLSLLAVLSALVLLWYVWRLSPARLQAT
jgi:ABC-2 type transport system permease protein